MTSKLFTIVSFVLIFSFSQLKALNDFKVVQSLAERRVPWLSQKLVFEKIDKENEKDLFILSQKKSKIKIQASSPGAASMALNYYLENYCHRSMSHLGDNISAVKKIPKIKKPVKKEIQFPIRYALNYCTINYTMSFYQWEDWERELDWMALHGVNLMLTPIGTEKVWQNTLRKFGYSEKEILDFIPGPAFTAWWLMGNLEGWGGAVSQSFIDNQAELQKKILARMKELGIEPVLQGFYGMVPRNLKNKYPSAEIIEQGKWAGGFERPDILNPTSSLFQEMASTYYNELKNLYGEGFNYFGGDLFHEGGNTGKLNITACGEAVQKIMQKEYPNSTWVLQGWSGNPKPELLLNLNKSKVLILDLFGENQDNWNTTKAYDGVPFVWCTVTNFGEKNGLYGKIQRFSNEIYRAKTSEYAKYMKGVGIMPEGINNNPVVYDFILGTNLHQEKINLDEWIKSYITYRYGTYNASIHKAWNIFLETIYSSFDQLQEGPPESVFCGRPAWNIKSVSTWGTRHRNYDASKFKEGVKLFLEAEEKFKSSETYNADKIDFLRQVLSNKGEIIYEKMKEAYYEHNILEFNKKSNLFLEMILTQDSLLSTNKYFSLSNWINLANQFGATNYDRSVATKNAKMQLTIWGPDWNPETSLHDYAAKEWGGLLKSFYYPRWKTFVEEQKNILRGKKGQSIDFFAYEKEWANSNKDIPEVKLNNKERNNLVQQILE